jgi:hypothetical protein
MESPEPNGKMDELLRAYAKKRREQAEPPLQMHPATRKLLQDEVKRTWGAEPAPPRQSWRTLRWPLLAMGSGFAALIVMLAVVNSQMRSLLPASAPMEQNVSQAKPMFKAPAPMSEKRRMDAAGSPQPLSVGNLSEPRLAADALVKAPPLGSDDSSVVAGEFVQVHDRAQKKAEQSPQSNILSAFRILRSGQNVRIVDADGSVYVGQVLISGSMSLGGRAAVDRYVRAKTRNTTNEGASWGFKVTGTNIHLQQNIVFTGNVLTTTASAPTSAAATLDLSASQVQNAPATAPVPAAQNSRITGQVQVGGGKEFEIEATSPSP